MKRILLLLCIFFTITTQAADTFWCMRTQSGDLVKMSDVSYLLTSSGAKDFSIVKSDNSQLQGVTSVNFVQSSATSIASVSATPQDPTLYAHEVDGELIVMGTAAGQRINIYTVSGMSVISAQTTSDNTRVDVSQLAHGVYILKVGKNSIKFIKK